MISPDFFIWCEGTRIGTVIRESIWMFPFIEAFHLLALALIGGAVLIVDLRLLGWALRERPLREVAKDANPWLHWSLATLVLTGVLLFLSEAVKCYDSPPFFVKMGALALALLFTFTVRRRVLAGPGGRPGTQRSVAVLSLLLWSIVGISGRAIGFY